MSSGWPLLNWADVASLEYGKALRGYQDGIGLIPVFGTNGPIGRHTAALCGSAGVIIGRKGAYRGVHFSPVPFYVIDTAFYLKPRPEMGIDAKWAYYCLLTYDINSMDSGSAIPSTSREEFYKLRLRLPPLAVQREIAAMLGTIDDRIALLRATNTTLEAIAQALFKSWFVDFDPVRAKQQGLAPAGMDEATAALFPDGFEESVRGLIPKGWRWTPFGELLSYAIGGDWGADQPDEDNVSKVAIIRGTDIPDIHSGSRDRVPYRYTTEKKLATRQLEDGDIILEVSGGSKDQPTGRSLYITTALIERFGGAVVPASFCRLLRPASREIGIALAQQLTFIYAQGKTWAYQNQSTGISNFQTARFFEAEMVAVPSQEVLAIFAATVRPMVDRAHLRQSQTLASLRDTLLPRLISGQLRLPEVNLLAEVTA